VFEHGEHQKYPKSGMLFDMEPSMHTNFVSAIATCLTYGSTVAPAAVEPIIQQILYARQDETPPEKDGLQALQLEIDRQLAPIRDTKIALVYGGATKIKGYVFEAPKLPEIRGASALLDWVNEQELLELWKDELAPKLGSRERAEQCIIYASGGNILAFAPASEGAGLASAVERCYTEHTLTGNSVAVADTFSLLELRYGRLRFNEQRQIAYWVDNFLQDWKEQPASGKLKALDEYYYLPNNFKGDSSSDEALRQRFFNRKSFGELVTVLATQFNRRRDQRAAFGEQRSVPFYPLLPWAAKCDSSDVRPAVWYGRSWGEEREMSEASARKRYVGQVVKRDEAHTDWFTGYFGAWQAPETLQTKSWEQRWQLFLQNNPGTHYARVMAAIQEKPRPTRDLHEIGAGSKGYIGVIFADGNNVGRLIATLSTPRDYNQKAHKLRDAAKAAVFHALSQHLEPVRLNDSYVHPFEILTIGGDDLLLIVPANYAFDITLMLGYHFERALGKELPRTLQDRYRGTEKESGGRFAAYTPEIGLSAGLVIAQENAPIFFLRDLAEELLKSAKQKARANAKLGDMGGAVDFMVMKSITMVTDKIKAFRKAALGDHDKSLRRLTGRPYTWHEFEGLLRTVRALKGAHIPHSQLHRLRRVLDEESELSTLTSTMEYLYTRARLQEQRAQTLAQHVEYNWRGAPQPNAPLRRPISPWLPRGTSGWETLLPDLVEVYDMLREEQDG